MHWNRVGRACGVWGGSACLVAMLSGCAMQERVAASPTAGVAGVHGRLMGGQQPVTGSKIYLIQAGVTGYGSVNASNIIATATSDDQGEFTLPAHTCTDPNVQTVLEARGGNPGLAAGTNNTAIYLAALTGPCGDLSPDSFINIDEVTTVAAAYAARPFVLGNNVGSSPGGKIGMANAVLMYNNLVDNTSGTSPGVSVPAGMAVPSAMIHSLANSLAACINSLGPTSTPCARLFTDTGVASTGLTANTFNIAVAIASAPTVNVGDIYTVAGSKPPFGGALAEAPVDWTLGVSYAAGNLNNSQSAMDIDFAGNVWVATSSGFAGTVEEISPGGVLLQTGLFDGVVDNPSGLVLDFKGALAVSSSTPGDVSILKAYASNPATVIVKFSNAIFQQPMGLAVDGAGDFVVADALAGGLIELRLNSASDYTTTGYPVQGARNSSFSGKPAVDPVGAYWVTMGGNELNSVKHTTRIINVSGSSGQVAFGSNFTGYEVPNSANLCHFALTDNQVCGSSYGTPDGAVGKAVAIDGLGKIWTGLGSGSFLLNSYLANFASRVALAPMPAGFQVSDMAIDSSGSIWLANGASGGLYEVVGIAAPVVTPLAEAHNQAAQGSRP